MYLIKHLSHINPLTCGAQDERMPSFYAAKDLHGSCPSEEI